MKSILYAKSKRGKARFYSETKIYRNDKYKVFFRL